MEQTTVQETIDLLKIIKSQQVVEKSWTVGTGLVNFDLEPAAKVLYPVITPLRNIVPRVKGNGDTATRWKQITAIDTTRVPAGVSEGNRTANISTALSSVTAAYKGIAKEDSTTFEAQYASEGYDNARAKMTEGLLRAVMIAEEEILLHGNSGTLVLGTTPTPVLTGPTAGGALTAQAETVYCVALSYEGWKRATVAGGVIATVVRTNNDGSSDTVFAGQAAISAASNAITTAAGNLTVAATVASVKGAYAYAWYIGTSAATALLHSITTINKQTFTANPAGTQAANAAGLNVDHSGDTLVFDGVTTLALSSTGYYKTLDGATLTADGAGGVVELDDALQSFWDVSKVTPTAMIMNSQQARDITKKVMTGGATPAFRINLAAAGGGAQGGFAGGALVTSYLNKFALGGSKEIPIIVHPNAVPGMIIFWCDEVPYPLSDIPGCLRIKARQEFYQIEWPFKSRKYEAGVYVDELLQMYTPFAFGVIQNIAAG